jgi:hypothetical protein
MLTLQVKRIEFEAIASSKKKIEWRSPSKYNKRLMLKKNNQGLYTENTDIKEVLFINGYRTNAPRVTVEVLFIRPYKFIRDIDEPENCFKANEGENAIGIHLGKIIE